MYFDNLTRILKLYEVPDASTSLVLGVVFGIVLNVLDVSEIHSLQPFERLSAEQKLAAETMVKQFMGISFEKWARSYFTPYPYFE